MSDLIDRQAVLGELKDLYIENPSCANQDYGWDAAIDTITDKVKDLPSAQPEIIRCKDCKHFEYDHLYIVRDIPVIGHLVCNKWGDGCRTDENGFCFMAERRTDGRSNQ